MNNTSFSQFSFTESLVRTIKPTARLELIVTSIGRPLNAFDIAYIIFGVFGIVGNSFCCVVLIGYKPLRVKLHNYFLISQFLINLVISILLIPTMLISMSNSIATCFLWETRIAFRGLYTSSLYSIALLAVERYLEVVHSVKHKIYATKNKVLGVNVAVWFFGISFKAAYTLPVKKFINGVCYTVYVNDIQKRAFAVLTLTIDFLFPLMTIVILYSAMACAMHSKSKVPEIGRTANSHALRARWNISIALIIVASCFFICNIHRQIVSFLYFMGLTSLDFTSTSYNVSQVMASASCCIYPYLCFYRHTEFKKGVRVLFGGKRAMALVEDSSSVNSSAKQPSGSSGRIGSGTTGDSTANNKLDTFRKTSDAFTGGVDISSVCEASKVDIKPSQVHRGRWRRSTELAKQVVGCNGIGASTEGTDGIHVLTETIKMEITLQESAMQSAFGRRA